MDRNIVVVGLGDYGSILARKLTERGYDVLGVDRLEERVQELSDVVAKVVQGEATSEGLWKDLPVRDMDIAIVAFSGDIGQSVLASLLLKRTGIKKVLAKSEGELHSDLLRAIGVGVIEPNKESALRTARVLGAQLDDFMEVTESFGVARIKVERDVKDLTIRSIFEKSKCTVLILCRDDRLILEPSDGEKVKVGDTLVIAGPDEDLRALHWAGPEKAAP